jgi:hypothetical protein
LKSSIL